MWISKHAAGSSHNLGDEEHLSAQTSMRKHRPTENIETFESIDDKRHAGMPVHSYLKEVGSVYNSFTKYSSHSFQGQNLTATTHAQILAIQRNSNNICGHFGALAPQIGPAGIRNPATEDHFMPEIAESVISQEEEDEFGLKIRHQIV